MSEWIKVVFAADCVVCTCCEEEPFCEQCQQHYADCECPGPTQDDEYEYKEVDGIMYAKLLT